MPTSSILPFLFNDIYVLAKLFQSCPILCNPMDWSLLKLMSIESVMPSNHLILCGPPLLPPSIFPSIISFPTSQFFTSGGQSTGVSASASVLPMNTQDWLPLLSWSNTKPCPVIGTAFFCMFSRNSVSIPLLVSGIHTLPLSPIYYRVSVVSATYNLAV